MTVEIYIKELLYVSDYIVVPGFGGFITQYESSRIHPVKNTFQPPRKKIAFNESLQSNDGFLINEISIGENISKEEATKLVQDFVRYLNSELSENDQVVFEEVGSFILDKEQNLLFQPDERANYLEDSYGLSDLYFKPIHREKESEEHMKRVHPSQARQAVRRAPVAKRKGTVSSENEAEKLSSVEATDGNSSNETVHEEPKKENDNKKSLFIILPVVLILLAGGLASYFIFSRDQDASHMNSASLTSMADSNESDLAESRNEIVEDNTEVAEEVAPVTEPDVVEEIQPEPVVTPKATTTSSGLAISNPDMRFHIVAGSFSNQTNATKMANRLQGASVISGQGNYRVVVGSFNTKDEAFSSLDSYKDQYGNNMWVLIQ